MKKYLLLFICLILIIIIIFKEKDLCNKNYYKNNININYPYFGNKKIDNYIHDLLFFNINKYDSAFIDYDYNIEGDNVLITFYKYFINKGILKNNTVSLNINLKKIEIKKSINQVKEYNIVNNTTINKNKKIIAFTFDDGPNHNTNRIIDILSKYNVRATFFVLGNRLNNNQDILKKMISLNMEIGNHTYSHLLLTRLNGNKIRKELDKTNNLIYDITGSKTILFRPSYGSINRRIKSSSSYPLILWNIDTLDWKYHNSKKIANKILTNIHDGDIVLMHDIYSATANALEIVIPKLLNKGYQIVTVSELFYYKNISLEPKKVYTSAN